MKPILIILFLILAFWSVITSFRAIYLILSKEFNGSKSTWILISMIGIIGPILWITIGKKLIVKTNSIKNWKENHYAEFYSDGKNQEKRNGFFWVFKSKHKSLCLSTKYNLTQKKRRIGIEKSVKKFKQNWLIWTFKEQNVGIKSDVKNRAWKGKTGGNTVYKLWLGLSSLGKSCGFSKASFYQERSVPRHATAHIHKRCNTFPTQ